MTGRAEMLEAIAAATVRAGAAVLAVYGGDFAVKRKADASPVTEADEAAEAILLAALAEIASAIPVVAEEQVAAQGCPSVGGRFFLVDPLDGTREFVERRGDFTVNVALVEAGVPTLGVVLAPVASRLWAGDVAAGEAWTAEVSDDGALGPRTPIRVRQPAEDALVAVASFSHNSPGTDAYLAALPVARRVSRGSSLKFCLVAEGTADVYPRAGPTCEWDIAAGDAVLRAAGGMTFGPDGTPMGYGKPDFRNRGFVAAGERSVPAIAPFLKDGE
jgi:3'(2'), 5'-bisphosphate nucleotidase